MALSDVPPDLIERCQQSQQEALGELYNLIREDMYRWIYSMVRNDDDAQELLQECMIRLLKHIPRLQDPKRFGAWASRLIVNQVNSWRVKAAKARTETLEEGWEAPEDSLPLQATATANPRESASRKEVLRNVNRAIAELPPKQRTAVMLFDVKGWSIKEIARELDCTDGAVKYNIFQGRRKLRDLLGAYTGDNGRPTFEEFD